MNNDTLTIDSIRQWTKGRVRDLKVFKKQAAKSADLDALLKGLDPEGWKQFRKKARQLKSQSRTAASFKNRVLKETDRDSKRFSKILAHLQAK
jgi:hypothetical protein